MQRGTLEWCILSLAHSLQQSVFECHLSATHIFVGLTFHEMKFILWLWICLMVMIVYTLNIYIHYLLFKNNQLRVSEKYSVLP